MIPLHCELVVGGRNQEPDRRDKGCSDRALERGEILPDPYFLFSLGNKIMNLKWTNAEIDKSKFKFFVTETWEEKWRDMVSLDISVGLMFDHTRATGGGWSIEIDNPLDNVLSSSTSTKSRLVPTTVSIALEDTCEAASNGSTWNSQIWKGDEISITRSADPLT